MRVLTRFERKADTPRWTAPNKYADLAPSAQKNSAGQRRVRRAQRQAEIAAKLALLCAELDGLCNEVPEGA